MHWLPNMLKVGRLAAFASLLALITGCVTRPKIDWEGRVGSYSFDEAVMEYGPPDKSADLSDGSKVVEWLTREGTYTVHGFGYGYYGRPFHPYRYYPGYAMGSDYVTKYPDRHLRLTFDTEGRLKGWKEFSR